MSSKSTKAGLILLFALSVITSRGYAGEGKDKSRGKINYAITGDISNMPEQMVTLELLRANDSVKIVDSFRSTSTGHFTFKGAMSEPGLYRVHFTENKFILLSLVSGEVAVTAIWPLNDYTITGPVPTLELKNFIDTVIGYMALMNRSGALADSLKATGNTSMDADAIKKDINTKFRTVVKRYSETTAYEPNAVIAARVLNPQEDFPFFESFNNSLDKRFAGTVMTREFHQFFERLKEGMPEPNEIGNKAPELKLEDTNGKIISLSSLQGKYVLLDFWASWCGPCRAENPNVLAAYKKFKNKNFTILAVSLDNNKAKWMEAVRHDALLWWQVSDLKGWQSPAAAKYGVRGIPMNFLIDPKGVIIAKNLRGPALEDKLGETLK
jgi:peroxiredoxin